MWIASSPRLSLPDRERRASDLLRAQRAHCGAWRWRNGNERRIGPGARSVQIEDAPRPAQPGAHPASSAGTIAWHGAIFYFRKILRNREKSGGGYVMATMTAATGDVIVLFDVEHGRELRKAIIASTVGTTIEWYDFLLYSVVTGLVFGKLFFPESDPLVGVLQAFAVYTVGFIARPIGAAIFGHYGDRIGRKAALIATLLITGLATFAVGLVPTYDSIGIWGAVILTIIRFLQGIGVGGEWGGSVLLSMEWARVNSHRGFVAS